MSTFSGTATYHLDAPFETFKLRDRAGNEHVYTVHYHDPRKAIRLCLRMTQAAGLSLSRVLEANLGFLVKTVLEGGVEALSADTVRAKLGRVLGEAVAANTIKLDATSLVADFVDVLLAADSEGLLVDVFAQTTRDGQHLSDADTFNHVYRANYGELRRAFQKIFEVNGFAGFLFGGTSSDAPFVPTPTTSPTSSPASPSSSTSSTG